MKTMYVGAISRPGYTHKNVIKTEDLTKAKRAVTKAMRDQEPFHFHVGGMIFELPVWMADEPLDSWYFTGLDTPIFTKRQGGEWEKF